MDNIHPFTTAGKLFFGPDSIEKLGEIVSKYGEKVLLVTGRSALKKTGIQAE